MSKNKIELHSVYKIFGDQPRGRALELARSGMDKDRIQQQTDHVVGLDDVNFSVREGEIFVVMGLSGSGNSTAIRTVNKLHSITAGEVLVDGVNVQKLTGRALQEFRRQKMGMVFQHFALFPHWRVIDNAGYGLKVQGLSKSERDRAALKALDQVGLAPFANSFPAELSGGMQQRVGLARALAADPDILLMDEAFSALDPLIRRQMQDDMMAIQAELHKTILFITHDLNEALRIGDRVCIMKDGKVIQIGSPDEILTNPADSYVAEFVQDVDQGRVIDVASIMAEPRPLMVSEHDLTDAAPLVDEMSGRFVVDENNRVVGLLTPDDVERARAVGSVDLRRAIRSDFDTTTRAATLNENYAAAGRGLPIAVLDSNERLVGRLEPFAVLAELGRVEELVESYRDGTDDSGHDAIGPATDNRAADNGTTEPRATSNGATR